MPIISIALYGRNDNYGGNYLKKLKLSIQSIQRSLDNMNYEIVLLDYNPPKDKPLLSSYFSSLKYPRIKHVVFSNIDYLKFIESHLKVGAQLKYKNKFMSEKEIHQIQFSTSIAMNLSIKYSSGDYILSTGTDNIFPIQFGNFVKDLEPNILYRTWLYRLSGKFNKIKQISFDKFDKLDNKINTTCYTKNNVYFKKKISIWSSAGNFILMDKNSWKEVGGYLPTIHPRLQCCDSQVIFFALALQKKIKCFGSPIFNIDNDINPFYKKITKHLNYIVKWNGIEYNHMMEIGSKQWKCYSKYARRSHLMLDINKEYFIDINYNKRLKEIKLLFKSFLDNKFLLY